MDKIQAGIIGLGVGKKHLNTLLNLKSCKVRYVCDFNKKKLAKFKVNKDIKKIINYREMLKDKNVNLVIIASYDNFHFEQIIECIKFKKNIFVEKPLCLDKKQLFKIRMTLKKNPSIQISSNFVLRTNKIFINLKNLVKKNKFGKPYYYEGDYNFGRLEKIKKGWRGKIKNYSVVHGGGIHLVDLILWLNKSKVKKVFASGNNISTKNTQFKNNDFVTSIIKFYDDSIAKINSNFGSCTPHHHILNIYGTKKTFMHNSRESIFYNSRDPGKKERKISRVNSYNNQKFVLESFVKSLKRIKKSIVTKEEIFNSMLVCLAIEESIKKNKWINIKSL